MAMYLWSTRYNVSQKNGNFFDLKLFVIFFHPRVRYDVKCICGAPSIARGGGNHRHWRDGNRRSTHSLVYLRIPWHQGMQVEMVAEGKTASRHLEMSKEICPQSFPSLDVFHVFAKNTRLLISPPPLPSIFRSFESQDFRVRAFSTIKCVEIIIFETIVWKGLRNFFYIQ